MSKKEKWRDREREREGKSQLEKYWDGVEDISK